MTVISQYYINQAGGGGSGHYYAGAAYQKGYGIGSWLGGLFRTILPVLRSGAAAVGKEAARAGSHVLADVAAGDNLRDSAHRHIRQAGDNLTVSLKRKADAMKGSGRIKRRKPAKKAHSAKVTRRRKILAPDNYFS